MKYDEYIDKLEYALRQAEAAKEDIQFAISYAQIADCTGDREKENRSRLCLNSARYTLSILADDIFKLMISYIEKEQAKKH